MTQDNPPNKGRRNFLKSFAATAAVGGLPACGGGSDDAAPNHMKYGFYFGEANADSLRDLAKFEAAVVHPNRVTAITAKATGIQKPIAYGSLIAIERSESNIAAKELANEVFANQWLLKNRSGFGVYIPGSELLTPRNNAEVVDIRIPEAYTAMKKYLTKLIDQGYEGIYLDGIDRAVSIVNADPTIKGFEGLTGAAVRLMNEVSDYARKRGKITMGTAVFTEPKTTESERRRSIMSVNTFPQAASGNINLLAEVMKASDITVVPQIFSAVHDDYEEISQKNTAARSTVLTSAAKASGKANVEIVGVEIARDPAAKICNTLGDYDALTKGTNIQYSVFFDRPLMDKLPPNLPQLPDDITYLPPRKLELTRPEIVAANAALVTQEQCLTR